MNRASRSSLNGATLVLWVAFFSFFAGAHASENAVSWFKAQKPIGSEIRHFTVQMVLDSTPVYKGDLRVAPASIPNQTLMAKRFVLQGFLVAPDTAFWWNTVILAKGPKSDDPVWVPLWVSSTRGGIENNEWTRVRFLQGIPRVDFHSPIYGDGSHTFPHGAIPEELLIPIAIEMMRMGKPVELRVMATLGEMPYTHHDYGVKGEVTSQRIQKDDVEAALVRFVRDDGAIAEVWLSTQGRRVLMARTFQGLWIERIQ